jgi:hypothetical protein
MHREEPEQGVCSLGLSEISCVYPTTWYRYLDREEIVLRATQHWF